ncbi:GAF and ANTAR domain-containing protein [Nonomuraea rhizosphaerae]|uniref:GAF and ANTAR domain-containing protein n=1 Tax=Nonomuraea rhizosphaerae TaxID=2665663 RepID=UPI001C5F3335|nr:GAF and ANTAR domain-containing protein [Nonomuraea rhizosphaerae]
MAEPSATREERIAGAFADLADVLADDFDVIDYLQRLTGHCVALLGVAAAGVLVDNGRGRPQLVAASTEQARVLEVLQIQQAQGPCFDTFATGEPVSCAELARTPDRWPSFTGPAAEAGYRGAHGLPMRLGNEVVGALNLFTGQARELSDADRRLGRTLACHAAIGLLGHRAGDRRELLVQELQVASHSRIAIEQAKGVLAESRGLSVEEAFAELRDYARRHRRKLSHVALAVVGNAGDVMDLTGRAPK